MRELKDMVEHHVQEEENEVFPKAQGVIPDKQADQLAGRVREIKKDEIG